MIREELPMEQQMRWSQMRLGRNATVLNLVPKV
jgi:hypothetical protein